MAARAFASRARFREQRALALAARTSAPLSNAPELSPPSLTVGVQVLEFRRKLASSVRLTEALDAVRGMLEPLYNRYEKDVKAIRPLATKAEEALGGGGTLSLKRFLDMAQDAELVGSQLSRNQVIMMMMMMMMMMAHSSRGIRWGGGDPSTSSVSPASVSPASAPQLRARRSPTLALHTPSSHTHLLFTPLRSHRLPPRPAAPRRAQVKMAFVNALQFSADTSAVRKPLLSRGAEFEEALVRLTANYDHPTPAGGGLDAPIGTPKRGRAQNRFSTMSLTSAAASSISAAVKQTLSTVRTAREKGGEAAPIAEADVAALEEAVLSKLPTVVGKLLAVLGDLAA